MLRIPKRAIFLVLLPKYGGDGSLGTKIHFSWNVTTIRSSDKGLETQ